MNWIQTALALLQFAPSILQLIQAIQLIFGKGNGPLKKALVMSSLPPDAPASIVDGVSKMVDSHVATLKAAKIGDF